MFMYKGNSAYQNDEKSCRKYGSFLLNKRTIILLNLKKRLIPLQRGIVLSISLFIY
jgi:hypothetical protein